MRIVHVEDRFHPEMGYQINYMARYHSQLNEFIIVTSESTSIWGNIAEDELKNLDKKFESEHKVKIIRLPVLMAKGQKSNIWIKGLVSKLKELQPDLVFAHCLDNYSSLRIFFSFSSKKVQLATDTHTLYNQFKGGIKEKVYFFFNKLFVVRKINKYKITTFFTATENKHILENKYGVNPELIYPCPIGVDLSVFKYDEKAGSNLREKLSLRHNEIVLIYTGKFNYRKQPHRILKAIEMIESKVDFYLTIVFIGAKDEKYYKAEFSNTFTNQKIKVVELPPKKNHELYKFYSMADFAVFPMENTLSALDSQACKLPVIMQNDETNAERLKKGGLLFKPNDISDLAELILKLAKDKALREELGKNGFEYVNKYFSYKSIIENVEAILNTN